MSAAVLRPLESLFLAPTVRPASAARRQAAYAFAARYVPGVRVLDCACGAGEGSALLLRAGATAVLGVDEDLQELARADARMRRGALQFRAGSPVALPLASGEVDVAVSLETLERVRDARRFVTELFRVLTPHGALVLSTPLTRGEARLHPRDVRNVREYDDVELASLLESGFELIARFGQHEPIAPAQPAWRSALRALLGSREEGPPPIRAEGWQDAPVQLVVARRREQWRS